MNGRTMLGIALCVAGLVFTFVIPTGRVWFGAIIYGGYLTVRGLSQGKS